MKSIYDIILKPVVTEKSMAGLAQKKYTFYVAPGANKSEIKKAVEEIFKVSVSDVHTIKLPGKWKKQGATGGYRPVRRKAIVTLSANSKTIEFFDGMM